VLKHAKYTPTHGEVKLHGDVFPTLWTLWGAGNRGDLFCEVEVIRHCSPWRDGDLDESDPGQAGEDLDPRHFHAAYVFDQAHERRDDVSTLIEQAQQLGYPMRYWWLSQAIDLRGSPDRLIVCVHHPSSAEDAGMDLYEALRERQVSWDDMEAAAVDEYRLLGKPVEGLEVICRPDGTPLFAPATRETLV
jgi:hypothetical protein